MSTAAELERHVRALAAGIGARNIFRRGSLDRAAAYIEAQFKQSGYTPEIQEFAVSGARVRNIEASVPGVRDTIVVGAHYDTAGDQPGANDNASGVAATLVLAHRFAGRKPDCTLRFVLFPNEEPPFFMSWQMGSYQYAKRCRERKEAIRGMMSLETIGYYSDEPGSQGYPEGLGGMYPDRANFIGIAGNLESRAWIEEVYAAFRRASKFPCERLAAPGGGASTGLSDHWSFWQFGYPGFMVTDTAFYRYDHYHRESDTPDKLDFNRMASVVDGLEGAIEQVCSRRG